MTSKANPIDNLQILPFSTIVAASPAGGAKVKQKATSPGHAARRGTSANGLRCIEAHRRQWEQQHIPVRILPLVSAEGLRENN